jgi:hypothetical protein
MGQPNIVGHQNRNEQVLIGWQIFQDINDQRSITDSPTRHSDVTTKVQISGRIMYVEARHFKGQLVATGVVRVRFEVQAETCYTGSPRR